MAETERRIYQVARYGKFAIESEVLVKETAEFVTVLYQDWQKNVHERRHRKEGWFNTEREAVDYYLLGKRRAIGYTEQNLAALREQVAAAEAFLATTNGAEA